MVVGGVSVGIDICRYLYVPISENFLDKDAY